jgi:hypothetical protein
VLETFAIDGLTSLSSGADEAIHNTNGEAIGALGFSSCGNDTNENANEHCGSAARPYLFCLYFVPDPVPCHPVLQQQ